VPINSLTLFLLTILSGISVFFIPNIQNKSFRNLLAFSGAYLFSMTVIHILPELFSESLNPGLAGIFVLVGFYFQVLLDYFSKGVEHGHIHHQGHEHSHGYTEAIMLFVSLWIHSFLEGGLLVHPHVHHAEADTRNILFGLSLHKIPEAIALISVLLFQIKNRGLVFGLLVLYSLSTPIGLFVSGFIAGGISNSSEIFTYLFAIVAGNFLHISTTIFFEAEQPGHKFKGIKFLVTSLGALLAVIAEYCL
jgi:zinc and cadmium transporter